VEIDAQEEESKLENLSAENCFGSIFDRKAISEKKSL